MPCVYLPGPAPAVTVANSDSGHHWKNPTSDLTFSEARALGDPYEGPPHALLARCGAPSSAASAHTCTHDLHIQ